MSILHGWQTASESRHARAHLSPRNNSSVSSHRNVFPQDARVIDVEGDLFCFTCRSDVTHAREMGDVKLLPLNVYLERCRLHFLPRGKTQWDTNSRNLVVPAPTCKLRKKKNARSCIIWTVTTLRFVVLKLITVVFLLDHKRHE